MTAEYAHRPHSLFARQRVTSPLGRAFSPARLWRDESADDFLIGLSRKSPSMNANKTIVPGSHSESHILPFP